LQTNLNFKKKKARELFFKSKKEQSTRPSIFKDEIQNLLLKKKTWILKQVIVIIFLIAWHNFNTIAGDLFIPEKWRKRIF